MNLPFTPSFFKRLEIYQDLKDFEEEGKETWKYEKKLLLEMATSKSISIGKPLYIPDLPHSLFKKPLDEETTGEEIRKANNVVDSLVARGLADKEEVDTEPLVATVTPLIPWKSINIKINARGYLAGRVLKETDGLRKTKQYEKYIKLWYITLRLAFSLLVLQILLLFLQVVTTGKDLIFRNKTEEKPTIINNIIMPTIPATPTITVTPILTPKAHIQ